MAIPFVKGPPRSFGGNESGGHGEPMRKDRLKKLCSSRMEDVLWCRPVKALRQTEVTDTFDGDDSGHRRMDDVCTCNAAHQEEPSTCEALA